MHFRVWFIQFIFVSDEINHSLDMSSLDYEGVTGSGVNTCITGIIQLVKWIPGIIAFERKKMLMELPLTSQKGRSDKRSLLVDEDLGSLQPGLALVFGSFFCISEPEECIVSFNGIYVCRSPRGGWKKKILQHVKKYFNCCRSRTKTQKEILFGKFKSILFLSCTRVR